MSFVSDYIRCYETAFPPELAGTLIDLFEKSEHQTENVFEETSKEKVDGRAFMDVNLAKDETFKDHLNILMQIAQVAAGKYRNEVPAKLFPAEIGCETFRIYKYRADKGDYFGFHTDVVNFSSARRFLTMSWFLNDVEEGGDLVFPFPNIRVRPKQGRLVMFPSMWMYPHVEDKPVSGDKYVLTTYLHYL